MRIHPIFTRIEDFNGDNYPDGVNALLEFQDQFGDATKASGQVIFELYSYQKFDAQRKGDRICNPWVGSLETMDDQRVRWNRTSRTYSFPLQVDQINPGATYVLTAEFQNSNGGRFYDQIILEPPEGAYAAKTPGVPPATAPSEILTPTTAPTSAQVAPSAPMAAPTTAPMTVSPSAPITQPTSQP